MFRFIFYLSLLNTSLSQTLCNLNDGFTWCATSNKCVRVWEEPCLPITKQCAVCLTTNYYNQGNNCGENCDYSSLQNLINSGFTGSDTNGCSEGQNFIWCDSLNRCIDTTKETCRDISDNQEQLCHEITCSMFCQGGFKKDSNGCDICECVNLDNVNDNNHCVLPEQECPYNFVCPKIREVTHCSENGILGYTTYELSLILKPNTEAVNIYALYGKENEQMILPPAYQESSNNIFNSNIGGVQQGLIDLHPDSQFDSWLTIGITDGDQENKLSSIGIDFDTWTLTQGLDIDNGAVFILDPQENIVDGDEYIIAQLTLPNNFETDVVFNVQGKTSNPSPNNKWSENNIIFHITPPNVDTSEIPLNCEHWFDGCNHCFVNAGEISSCTRMMCSSTSDPHCLLYSDEDNNGH